MCSSGTFSSNCYRSAYLHLVQSDSALTNFTFKSISTYHVIRCALRCQADPECKSLNFCESSGLCELNNSTLTESVDGYLMERHGCVYYEYDDVTTQKHGACVSNPCTEDSSCTPSSECSNTGTAYKCSAHAATTTTTPTTTPTPTKTTTTTTTTQSREESTSTSTATINSEDEIDCSISPAGLYPHPTDCSQYINCGSGMKFVYSCAAGTVFNPTELYCDWPYNVPECNSNHQTTAKSETTTAVQTTAGILTTFACERSTLAINCNALSINIMYANYGRTATDVCSSGSSVTNCIEDTSLSVVAGVCEGKVSCSIDAQNSVFGDPCSGVQKYLEVQYECV
ncbi:uncharacterized protein LOC144438987 [Glandiceps talaboti]